MKNFLILYKSETLLQPVFNARSLKATCFSDAETKFKVWAALDLRDVVTITQITLIT